MLLPSRPREPLLPVLGILGLAGLLSATLALAASDSGRRFASVAAAGEWGGSPVAPANLPEAPLPDAVTPPQGVIVDVGDARAGEKIFFEKAEVFCCRCHSINGRGGSVGPDLSHIGATKTRDYLLESLLDPNRVIAEGFSTLLVETSDGILVFGVIREDGPQQVRLVDVEAREHTIPVGDIEGRRPGQSAMPGDLKNSLTPGELRDLVEFLANLK